MKILNEEYAQIAYDIFEYNQSRFRLKNIINNIANSKFKEQKSYNLKDAVFFDFSRKPTFSIFKYFICVSMRFSEI